MFLHAVMVTLLITVGYVDSGQERWSVCRYGEKCINVGLCPEALAEMRKADEKMTSEEGEGEGDPEDFSMTSNRPFCGYDITSPKYRFKVCCPDKRFWAPSYGRSSGRRNNRNKSKDVQLKHQVIDEAVEANSIPWSDSKVRDVCRPDGPGFDHPKLHLLPRDCGYARAPDLLMDLEQQIPTNNRGSKGRTQRPPSGRSRRVKRVYKGTEAGFMSQPWMARLIYSSADNVNRKNVLCGGTLITERYVLTAAHCVKDTEDSYLVGVSLGERDRRRNVDCRKLHLSTVCASDPLFFKIESVHVNRYFQSSTLVHDIALIRLIQKADISLVRMSVAPICLPTGRLICEPLYNKTMIVAGWGKPDRSRTLSEVLRTAELSQVSQKLCHKNYIRNNLRQYVNSINSYTLCAIGRKQDSCQGDSGGPLQLLTKEGVVVQHGIVSFGSATCNNEALPGVYIRVARYMQWILDVIKP